MSNYFNKGKLTIILGLISLFPVSSFADSEYYSTNNYYKNPHFNLKSLELSNSEFSNLVESVRKEEGLANKAFFIDVPDELYSSNSEKLKNAGFFQYYAHPEKSVTVWSKLNGSGAPLASTHTYGAKAVVYYKTGAEYFFLLSKEKFGPPAFQFPGGYVQPTDDDIVKYFENKQYGQPINYRNPKDVAITEVLEETGFNLLKYGFNQNSKPPVVADMYNQNTREERGIHSPNDHCTFLAFKVTPNSDQLSQDVREIEDVLWASYTDIMNGKIKGKTVSTATGLTKDIVERIVKSEQFMELWKLPAVDRTELDSLSKELAQRRYDYKRGNKFSDITLHNVLFLQ